MSDIDCTSENPLMDYYSWRGMMGDAWIVIPFLLGMLVYKLFLLKYDKYGTGSDRVPAKGDDDYYFDQESPRGGGGQNLGCSPTAKGA